MEAQLFVSDIVLVCTSLGLREMLIKLFLQNYQEPCVIVYQSHRRHKCQAYKNMGGWSKDETMKEGSGEEGDQVTKRMEREGEQK